MSMSEHVPASSSGEFGVGAPEGRAAADRVKDRLRQAGHDVAERGRRVAETARGRIAQEVRTAAQSGASCVATGFRDVGDALSDASNTLRERKDTKAASYVSGAADGIRRASQYLEERSPDQMAEDAGGVVRRHPAIALGGLFAVGLLVGRFLRASAPDARERRRSAPEGGTGMESDLHADSGSPYGGVESDRRWSSSTQMGGSQASTAPEHTGNPPYGADRSEGSEAL